LDIFQFPLNQHNIRGDVREDGNEDENLLAKSKLIAEHADIDDEIEEAAEGCPVEIIKYEIIDD
jgi:ferredoxin